MNPPPTDPNPERPGVAPDGSPVELYRHLPPGDDPELIHGAVGDRASILELGCGAGRVTHALTALGHQVTAVDESPEMLRHVHDAETILADIFTLALDRQFDAVVLASHIINQPEARRRQQLLSVCKTHARPEGTVVIQRFHPNWMRTAQPTERRVGPVAMRLHDITHEGELLHASVSYELNGQEWTQTFTAAVIEDDALSREALSVGLSFERWLDEAAEWALLRS